MAHSTPSTKCWTTFGTIQYEKPPTKIDGGWVIQPPAVRCCNKSQFGAWAVHIPWPEQSNCWDGHLPIFGIVGSARLLLCSLSCRRWHPVSLLQNQGPGNHRGSLTSVFFPGAPPKDLSWGCLKARYRTIPHTTHICLSLFALHSTLIAFSIAFSIALHSSGVSLRLKLRWCPGGLVTCPVVPHCRFWHKNSRTSGSSNNLRWEIFRVALQFRSLLEAQKDESIK